MADNFECREPSLQCSNTPHCGVVKLSSSPFLSHPFLFFLFLIPLPFPQSSQAPQTVHHNYSCLALPLPCTCISNLLAVKFSLFGIFHRLIHAPLCRCHFLHFLEVAHQSSSLHSRFRWRLPRESEESDPPISLILQRDLRRIDLRILRSPSTISQHQAVEVLEDLQVVLPVAIMPRPRNPMQTPQPHQPLLLNLTRRSPPFPPLPSRP